MVNINENTILWDYSIITDRKILADRPDIVIHDDKNIALKEAEKNIKYKDLEIEINRMWNVKTKVDPVVVGALGTLRKDFAKGAELIPGSPKISEIQKISLLDTTHILDESLRVLVVLRIHPSPAGRPRGIK